MDVSTLGGFNLYTYGDKALHRWGAGIKLREELCRENLDTVISEYEMACELFLKHIISRTGALRKDHVHSHNVWALACDAEVTNRERYRTLLKKLGQYYLECRYECEDIETEQALRDYFMDSDVFEQADQLLLMLHTAARDADRIVTRERRKDNLKSLDLK